MRYVVAFIATGFVFLLLDGAFLTVVGPKLYRPDLNTLLGDKVRLAPAALFYLLYIFGLTWFCVTPALQTSWVRAFLPGLILGLVAYGTYDFTCQAVMRVWSWKITFFDLAWGAFASATAAGVGALAASKIGGA